MNWNPFKTEPKISAAVAARYQESANELITKAERLVDLQKEQILELKGQLAEAKREITELEKLNEKMVQRGKALAADNKALQWEIRVLKNEEPQQELNNGQSLEWERQYNGHRL